MFYGIGLDNPKTDINVGAVLRAAGVYKAAFVAARGGRFKSAITDTVKSYRYLPLLRPRDLRDVIPF